MSTIVIGGGVAGLHTAYVLSKAGEPVTLIEPRGRCGGLVCGAPLVFPEDGEPLWVDIGAESYAKRSRYLTALCQELGLDVMDPGGGGSWIWSHADGGFAYRIPHGVLGIPTSLSDPEVAAALSPAGLKRATADLSMGPTAFADADDLATLVAGRLGPEVLDRLVRPIAGGVHSADPSRLAVDSVTPGLRAALAEQGSLVAAAAALRAAAPPGAVVASVRGGMFRLCSALSDAIVAAGGTLLTRHTATDFRPTAAGWQVSVCGVQPGPTPADDPVAAGEPQVLTADRLVLAANGRVALAALQKLDEFAAFTDWQIPSGARLASVTLAVDCPELNAAPRGSGCLVTLPTPTDSPRVAAKAITHYSVKWPWVLDDQPVHVLRLSYGRAGEPQPQPTLAQALNDASVLLGVPLSDCPVRGQLIAGWGESLPPLTPQHREWVARLSARVAELPGFAVVGAWVAGTGLAAIFPHAEAEALRLLNE